MGRVIGMIPGMAEMMKQVKMNEADIEKSLARMRAMHDSMTRGERDHPDIIGSNRRRRIARGAGVSLTEVSQFLRQFEQSRNMMRAVGSMGMIGRARLAAAMSAPSVLGLVTNDPIKRDPSYVHSPAPGWPIVRLILILIAVTALIAFAYNRLLH
jgi:signal recognition particle GTPase